jgi:hypothetical protein
MPEETPVLPLPPALWDALLTDCERLLEDIALGFGGEHVVCHRARALLTQLTELALEMAQTAARHAPATRG